MSYELRGVLQPVLRGVLQPVVPLPPPPGPPGPLDLLVPGDLNGVTFEYTNTHPYLHCRIAAINAGGTATPTVTVSVDGDPMTFVVQDTRAVAGHPIAVAQYITDLAPGTHTITIAVANGSVVNGAVRLGEVVSQGGIGAVGDPSAQSDRDYYIEMYCDITPATSQMGSIAVFNDARGYPITSSFDDSSQWTTWQPGLAARFATDAGPSGEGQDPTLFVYYTASGANYGGAAVVYEIIDAVLP